MDSNIFQGGDSFSKCAEEFFKNNKIPEPKNSEDYSKCGIIWLYAIYSIITVLFLVFMGSLKGGNGKNQASANVKSETAAA